MPFWKYTYIRKTNFLGILKLFKRWIWIWISKIYELKCEIAAKYKTTPMGFKNSYIKKSSFSLSYAGMQSIRLPSWPPAGPAGWQPQLTSYQSRTLRWRRSPLLPGSSAHCYLEWDHFQTHFTYAYPTTTMTLGLIILGIMTKWLMTGGL